MITINFEESTFVFDMLGDFEYYYQEVDPEILPLLRQLDIKYEPDDEAKSQVEEVYKSSLTAVTIRGNANVLDQLAQRNAWIYLGQGDDPWFLSKYVSLADMDEAEASYLSEKYGDAIPEDLRADFSALLKD